MSSDSELGILRQLLHREQAFFDIEHQQAKLFEKDSFNSIKNLIFITRKVFSLHLSVLEQYREASGESVDVPDLSDLSNSMPPGFTPIMQRAFQTSVAGLLSSPSGPVELVELLQTYLKENPEKENYVVFSFLPALFSCLWSLEEANRFVDLVLMFPSDVQPSLTRLLLVHPSFFVFLSSIQNEAAHLLGTADLQMHQIIDLFMSRLFLFPASLRSLLLRQKPSSTNQFFVECVLKPVLCQPALYGLVPSSEFRTFENLFSKTEFIDNNSNSNNNGLENLITPIIDALRAQESTIQMQPTEAALASVIAANEQLIYFLKNDCLILQSIIGTEIYTPQCEAVFQIPCKRVPSSISSRINGNQKNITQKNIELTSEVNDQQTVDPFEALLRKLVIQLDVARTEANIIDTLDAALMLHAGASRLQFELRLDEFKQMKKQRDAPDDVSYYVQLLTSAYEQRMKHRKATLSNSTASDVFKVQHLQSSQAVHFLSQTRQMTLFNMWVEKCHPFDQVREKLHDFCQSGSGISLFSATYKSLLSQFISFVEEKRVNSSNSSNSSLAVVKKEHFIPIVYNRLTKIVTLSEFISNRPELKELDLKIHEMIEKNREMLHTNNNQNFLNAFKEDPKLMGLAAEHLKRAFEEESVIPIAECVDRALNALIHVLSFQGYKEIGGDHWLPMTLILFIHVNPKRIFSMATYMHQFLLSLSDGMPINQSTEYNVTMMHSAASYFQKELAKMSEAQK